MNIFEYKKNKMLPFEINKMNLYKKEADIIEDMYCEWREDISYIKINIDDIDFFNKFLERRYKLVCDGYNVSHVNFSFNEITDRDTRSLIVVCYKQTGNETYIITESFFTDLPPNKVNINNHEDVSKFTSGDDSYYLEINFYSMYLFMDRIAANAASEAITVLYEMLYENYNENNNLDDIKKELKIEEQEIKLIEKLLK